MKNLKALIGAVLLLSGLGFVDSAFLAVNHFRGDIPKCSVVHGCDVVLTSSWSTIGPVPLALVGAVYYLTVFALTLSYFDTGKVNVLRMVGYLTIAGLVTSAWLFYLQLAVIEAFCLYCLISAITSTFLFLVGMLLVKAVKRDLVV